MKKAAFTLWELLVAIALLLMIAALVVPISLSYFVAATFDEAGSQVAAVMAMARADAQREGKPVQIALKADSAGAWHVVRLPDVPPQTVAGAPIDYEARTASVEAALGNDASAKPLETLATLPAGVHVSRAHTVVSTEDDSGEAAETATADDRSASSTTSAEATVGGGFLIATFMPDGEPTGCAPWTMTDSRGRSLRIAIDPWTGQVKVQQVKAQQVKAASTTANARSGE